MSTTLDDRYELLELIAVGGMGEVWRARDHTLHREVAVKLLLPEYAGDAEFRDRFRTEARNAGHLLDPGIAAVFDYGERTEEGRPRPFLVMEYVDGEPLSALLRSGTPMAPEVTADLIGQAARALAVAHAQGIVHRDLKPANLLVTPDGRLKVTDFGIARSADAVPLTRTGQLMGTPQYLSPEQAEGRSATPASDVYALGVVLFECLTGARPFDAETPVATAVAHLQRPVPELPDDVPPGLAAVTRKAMAKDPAERYPDGAALAAALADPGAEAAAAATRTLTVDGVAAAAVSAQRRIPRWWPFAALGVAAALVLTVLLVTRGGETPPISPSDNSSSTGASPSGKVRVDAADYVGRDAGQAAKELRRLGLRARVAEDRAANDGSHEPGTVARLRPTGLLAHGTLVTLTTWGDRPPPPQEPRHTTRHHEPAKKKHEHEPGKKHGPPKGHDRGNDKGNHNGNPGKGHHMSGKGGHHG